MPLADVVGARPEKKLQEKRKVAAALLYRLGAFDILAPLANGEGEIIEVAFACAGGVRMGRWRDGQSPRKLGSRNWEASFYGRAMVSLSEAEATGKLDPLLDELEAGPADELKLFGRWGVTASPLEKVLAERFLERTDGGNAKSRARATSFLCGLAYPRLVPLLMNRLARNEIEAAQAINILGETGGSQAVGLLLDMLRRGITVLGTLGHVSDPATVPVLLKLLERSVAQGVSAPIGFDAGSIEYTLASLGDGIADQLAGEMRARQGTAMAASIQRTLLQMNGKRAKDALKGTDTESIQSLVSRLGRPNVSKAAIKALIRKGDEAVESVETVAAQGDYLAASDALRVLDGIGTGRATRAVQTTLEKRLSGLSAHYGNEASLCVEAVNIVSKRQGAGAISLLVRALGVNCGVVQNAAVDALVRIGVEVVPHVLPLLASPQASARASALGVVGRLRVAVAEEKVLELLADTDQRVRNAAAAALGEICKVTGNQRVADALGKALLAGAFAMPYPGIQALGQTGQRSAIPYLRKFLETNPGNSYYIDQAIKKIEATSPAGVSGFAGKLKGFFGGGR